MSYLHFYGIDVSKEWFDVALHGAAAKPRRYANDSAGFSAFVDAHASTLPQALVVLESTGGYEAALIVHLLGHDVAVHRAHPLTARHFIRSLRLHAKTDLLDALGLARYAAERHACLGLCRRGDAGQERLELLLARRADLVAMRAAEQNRLKHPRYKTLKASLESMLKAIGAEITAVDETIEALIAASARLSARRDTLTAVKGVGKQTAATLLALMPELGTLTRRQAASLAGCAPHPKDSGKAAGYRATRGGRILVKKALFMAAMAARRFHPELSLFYRRLIQNGKKPIVAITAIMRKLIVILNAKIRDDAMCETW